MVFKKYQFSCYAILIQSGQISSLYSFDHRAKVGLKENSSSSEKRDE